MKKVLVTLCAASALLFGGSASADINVAWQAAAGFFANGTAGNYPADGINNFNGGQTLSQLIWSPDNVVSPVDPGNAGNGFADASEIVLNTFTVVGPVADNFAYFVAPGAIYENATFGQTLENGFVYARIFSDETPGQGDNYYNSVTLDATPFTGIEAPQLIEMNTDLVNGNELDMTIPVPEPSVFAFFGIGALVLAIRRLRK